MADLSNVNQNVDPNATFDPLPTAWYVMAAVKSEWKPTKNNDGQYLQIEFEVDPNHHPELKGRKVWDRLNLQNKNEQAVEIAQRTLKALIVACGKSTVSNSEELHGIPVLVKVVAKPARDGYDASNDVKGYKPLAEKGEVALGAAQGDGGAAAAPAAKKPARAGAAGKPPWA